MTSSASPTAPRRGARARRLQRDRMLADQRGERRHGDRHRERARGGDRNGVARRLAARRDHRRGAAAERHRMLGAGHDRRRPPRPDRHRASTACSDRPGAGAPDAASPGRPPTAGSAAPPPAPARAADTASTASGADPYTLESRTRTCAPSTCGRTTIRSVPPPATARGGGPGCMAACHAVTQPGPHAAPAAARGRPTVPRHPTSATTSAATATTATTPAEIVGRGRAGTRVNGTTGRSGSVTMSRTSDSRCR